MPNPSGYQNRGTLKLARIAWTLAALICLITIENIWFDPWLIRRSHHKLPSFVPESLGGTWAFVLALLGSAAILAILCLILIIRDKNYPAWKKALTALSVVLAVALCGVWFSATGGADLIAQSKTPRRDHTVTLRWTPSTTKNVRYNVYRGKFPGKHSDKLNSMPLDQPTYTDTAADDGATYYYVARAVDSLGNESADSNEARVEIPH